MNLHAFHFQYPRDGAGWTFCSLKSRFSAVATAARGRRSCPAKSRLLTITSPVGGTPCPYPEMLAANNRNSFLLFRSVDLAPASSVSRPRKHITATPSAKTTGIGEFPTATDQESPSNFSCGCPMHYSTFDESSPVSTIGGHSVSGTCVPKSAADGFGNDGQSPACHYCLLS